MWESSTWGEARPKQSFCKQISYNFWPSQFSYDSALPTTSSSASFDLVYRDFYYLNICPFPPVMPSSISQSDVLGFHTHSLTVPVTLPWKWSFHKVSPSSNLTSPLRSSSQTSLHEGDPFSRLSRKATGVFCPCFSHKVDLVWGSSFCGHYHIIENVLDLLIMKRLVSILTLP